MRFRIEQRFPAPLADVEAGYTDPAFLERLGDLPKLGRPRLVGQHRDGNRIHQQVHYRFTGDINAAVRRVVDPEKLTWIEDATIDLETHTTAWHIVPDHYRALLRCEGTFALRVAGAETLRLTEAEMRVSVPLVGGRVERAIVSGLVEHAERERDALVEWLAERQGP